MVLNINRTDTLQRVLVKHPQKQVHELGILVQTVAVVLLQCARQVFESLLLFCQYFLTHATLNSEDSHADQGFTGLSLSSAFHTHPNWYASQHLQKNCAE